MHVVEIQGIFQLYRETLLLARSVCRCLVLLKSHSQKNSKKAGYRGLWTELGRLEQ